ncbi:MAG: hypothetical protein ACI9I4_002304 [Neolewinella sp.]
MFLPRPARLSGCVNTPTILTSASSKASRLATAKSGVPAKIIRDGELMGKILGRLLGFFKEFLAYSSLLHTRQIIDKHFAI